MCQKAPPVFWRPGNADEKVRIIDAPEDGSWIPDEVHYLEGQEWVFYKRHHPP